MIDHADGRPSPMTYFKEGFETAAESRDQRIKELEQRIRDLSRYAVHEFGCPAIGAAGDCDCGVEEFWDHG